MEGPRFRIYWRSTSTLRRRFLSYLAGGVFDGLTNRDGASVRRQGYSRTLPHRAF
jgi:hypothetical protein